MTVLKAIRNYVVDGESDSGLGGAARMAFSFLKAQVDRDLVKWEDARRKRSEAGKTGAESTNKRKSSAKVGNAEQFPAKVAEGGNAEQYPANPAVNVNVNGNVNVPYKNVGCIAPPSRSQSEKERFVPPTVEQVAEYVKQRRSSVDPQGFIDFYTSKGWMVGKTPMKDWKAACRNAEHWERWEKKPVDSRNTLKTDADYDTGGDFFSC